MWPQEQENLWNWFDEIMNIGKKKLLKDWVIQFYTYGSVPGWIWTLFKPQQHLFIAGTNFNGLFKKKGNNQQR